MTRAVLTLVLAMLLGVGAVWKPYDPDAIDLTIRHAGSSLAHPFGTDQLGRDLLSRILEGGAQTLMVVVLVTMISVAGGLALGTAAAFAGGWRERVLLRGAEMSIVVPTLVFGVTAASIFGLNPISVGLTLGLAGIGPYALLTHSLVRRALTYQFVTASQALGVPAARVFFRHVLPTMLPVLSTHTGNHAGLTVVAFASLAFLGIGTDPSQGNWGSMLFEYRTYTLDNPMLMVWPGLCIAVTALVLSLSLDP